MKVHTMVAAGLALALLGSFSAYAAESTEAAAKPKVTVITGRGGESGKIIEPDGTVRELTRGQLTFKNAPSARLLEANDQRAAKALEDAKQKEDEKQKLQAKKTEDAKKQTAADAAADKKKALEDKKKVDDAEKQKTKAVKAYNDKSYEFTGKPYVPPDKKKSPFETASTPAVTPQTGATPGNAPQAESANAPGAADQGIADSSKKPGGAGQAVQDTSKKPGDAANTPVDSAKKSTGPDSSSGGSTSATK